MTKQEFLQELKLKLKGLSKTDINDSLEYYSEMIDDKTEEGILEEDAVKELGSIDDIAKQIAADTPFSKPSNKNTKPKRRLKTWEIVLLALGSPIWISLLIAAFAVIFSVYISLWAVIISLWAAFAAIIGAAFGGVGSGIVLIAVSKTYAGIAMIGAAIFCAGLSIFTFYGCEAATKGVLMLTNKLFIFIKNCFIKKGEA